MIILCIAQTDVDLSSHLQHKADARGVASQEFRQDRFRNSLPPQAFIPERLLWLTLLLTP